MFLKSLPSSNSSQVVFIKISKTDVELKMGSSSGMSEEDKYGNGLGTRVFDGK